LVAIAGLGYSTVVLVGLARASVKDTADQFSPRRVSSFRFRHSAPTFWRAALVLLAVNIGNAWDLMLAFARQIASRSLDTWSLGIGSMPKGIRDPQPVDSRTT